ncbi:MAG: elongation factor P [Planctomycetota bacterium]|nr:MAG: elongation factor P [Planctomycetota bacterium]
MAAINTSELKNGLRVLFDGQPYVCQHVDFVKPGKGAAFYKLRVMNLLTGNVLEKTLRSGEKVETADVVDTDMEYLYQDGDGFVFMDSTTFDQISVEAKAVGSSKDFLLENTSCVVTLWNGNPIAIRLPNTITLEVTYTEPAVKGDTQSRVMKEATLNTGAVVSVPTFIDIGEKIIIDTRTREYTGRVSK